MYEVYAKLRDERGLTDYKVAKDLGFSRTALSGWKNGKYTPKADKIQKLADYFDVTPEYLMTGEVKEGYYINQETAEMAQQIFENSKMRILFDAAKDADPEDLQMAADMLYRLKAKALGLDNDDGC